MAYGKRAVVVEFLSRMVQEGTIVSFQTLHFGKAETGEDPTVLIAVAGEMDKANRQALAQQIRATLQPLVGDVVVSVQGIPTDPGTRL